MDELRATIPDTILLSFPGDERADGGCVLFEKREQVEVMLAQK